MRKKLLKIPYSRFRKQELPEFIVRVIDAGEKHNPASLHLEAALEKVKDTQTLIDELQVLELGHPLTPELQAAYKNRNNYIGAISGQVKSARKANLPDKQEAVLLAEGCVKKYFSTIHSKGLDEKSRFVKLFIAEVKGAESLTNAFEVLGLNAVILSLETVQGEISGKSLIRRDENGVKPKSRTREIFKELALALNGYFGAIEAASFMYPNLDYSKLIDTINEDIRRFKVLFSLRSSANKQKIKKAIETAAPIQEQAS